MHSEGFDVPAKKTHQTVSDSVSVAYITSIQESGIVQSVRAVQ